MLLDKATQFRKITIWEPRWHDKKVLIASRKVGEHNKIIFTGVPGETNYMGDKPYYLSGQTIKKCKKESNGTIDCYVVPLDKLEPLELTQHSIYELY